MWRRKTKNKSKKKSINKEINRKNNIDKLYKKQKLNINYTNIRTYISCKIDYFTNSILLKIVTLLSEIKVIILNWLKILRQHFLPRLIILFLVWSIFRLFLYILNKTNIDISMLPIIWNLNFKLNYFFTTILDIWLIVGIISFFIITLFKMITEAKNDKI